MAELKDSGARRGFGTGAVRDVADGKGRCDLLPLTVVSDVLPGDEGEPLDYISGYILNGNKALLIAAIRSFAREHYDGCLYTAILEAAKQYEDGCQKYGERNWENGIPLHCYIDSGVRHYLKHLRGDKDEPHDRAFLWNMLGAIWTHENRPEMIDLPFADIGIPITDEPVEPWGDEDCRRRRSIFRCRSFINDCEVCPLRSLGCVDYCIDNPAEARKLMDEWEAEHD